MNSTMNSKKGFRKANGDFLRAAAGAAVLIVAMMSTAALWTIAARGSGAPSSSSSQPATAGASVSLAGLALTVGGVLVALMVVVLTVDYGRRRIAHRRAGGRSGGGRRGGAHAKASRSRADGAINSVTATFPLNAPADTGGYWSTGDPGLGPPDLQVSENGDRASPGPAGPPESEDEYPSWPGPPGPYALHPDHPSWPGRPDPRWAATEAILREDDYPSWPEPEDPPWPDAALPVPENGDHGSPGDGSGARQEPASAPSRGPHGMPAARPELALPVRVRRDFTPGANRTPGADLAPQPGLMSPPGAELALPSSGLQEDQGPGQPDAPGAHEYLHEP